MESLGFPEREAAELQTLTADVVKTSEIEGELLHPGLVRSSLARRLGMDVAAVDAAEREVDGVVDMTLEATQNYAAPLTKERLFRWHRLLFPDPAPWIRPGTWRDDARGPMQVVSGKAGRQRVHYEAPPAERLEADMAAFFAGVKETRGIDPLLRAAQAHLWFVTIHPFDDGNGRVARAIADWALAQSEDSPRRYYSMSAQICRERDGYYAILERTQKGTLDITEWHLWFLDCMNRAISETESSLAVVLRKDLFWKHYARVIRSERQRRILNRILDGELEGKLTSSTWAKLAPCSQDTATRDLQELAGYGILVKNSAGGRSTSYSLARDFAGAE